VLFPVLPLAYVLTAICPSKLAMAFALVIKEVSLIALAVFPREDPVAMHLVALPLALEELSIWPVVLALS
jgi:hypothetical protein